MSRNLLVGTDCSDGCERALDYAAERARQTDSKLIVAHVIEWSQFRFTTPEENATRHKRREEEIGRARAEIIDPIVQRFREQGIDAEGVVRHGHTAEVLRDLAVEFDVDLIIVGRQAESRFKAAVFGSVTAALIQVADRPVTVVP